MILNVCLCLRTLEGARLIELHSSVSVAMFVARQGDVSRKLNQAFLLVDLFNSYFYS